jgi:hypothetical protein
MGKAKNATSIPPAEPKIDYPAICGRLEQIIETLRTRYIREGWRFDEKDASQALAHMRMLAKGPDEDVTDLMGENAVLFSQEVVFDFLFRHGQSLDWVFRGDIGSMISRCAALEFSKP